MPLEGDVNDLGLASLFVTEKTHYFVNMQILTRLNLQIVKSISSHEA